MSKVHNFTAGPCVLPQAAIDAAIEALKDFKGTGVPVICISHRTKEWDSVMDECRALWRELLDIPEGYEIVFLGGGASMQFLYVAMNFLEHKAAYLDTGVWASKALKEAKGLGDAYAIASSKDKNYTYIPKGFEIPTDIDYFHITTNNTIYGTEIKEDLDSPVPLIADMSSDILSRRVDVSKYACIYAGAQKNAGPAGVAVAIIRKDALGKVTRYLPTMLDYRTHIDKGSMFNTPPVFSIFVMNETLKWLKAHRCDPCAQCQEGRNPLCRDRPQSVLHRHRRQGGPFHHEHLFRHGARQGGACGRVPRACEGARDGGHQGPPQRRRLPCLRVQCLHPGGCRCARRLHAGIRSVKVLRP